MNYFLNIRKEAEIDIKSAFEYYEKQLRGLGYDFILCVEDALSKIERNPSHYKIIYKELRRIAIRRFPYRIIFSPTKTDHSHSSFSCKKRPSNME